MKLTIERVDGLYIVDYADRSNIVDSRRIFTTEQLAAALCRWDTELAAAIGPIKAEIDKQLGEWRQRMLGEV